jgi:hypothetical protein
MSKLLGVETRPDPEVLQLLRERLKPGQSWAAYQSMDMSSVTLGDLRFLLVGPDATFATAPESFPDSHLGIGWRFRHIGHVDLEVGKIVENQ